MTVFQPKSYRKTAETPQTLTVETAKSQQETPFGGSGGEGSGVFAENTQVIQPETPAVHSQKKTLEMPQPPTARTAKSPFTPPSGSFGSGGSGAHFEKTAAVIPALPERLVRLVRAAAGGHLNHPAALSSSVPGIAGRVSDLGDFVLSWAATYACGGDREHVLARLEAAYVAWSTGQGA